MASGLTQCDPGDCTARCTHCGPADPCGTEDCLYDPAYRQQVHAAWPKRLTDAEAIHRIMVAGRGAEEHRRRWQNGFISESAYNAAVETAIREIARVLRETGR